VLLVLVRLALLLLRRVHARACSLPSVSDIDIMIICANVSADDNNNNNNNHNNHNNNNNNNNNNN